MDQHFYIFVPPIKDHHLYKTTFYGPVGQSPNTGFTATGIFILSMGAVTTVFVIDLINYQFLRTTTGYMVSPYLIQGQPQSSFFDHHG